MHEMGYKTVQKMDFRDRACLCNRKGLRRYQSTADTASPDVEISADC